MTRHQPNEVLNTKMIRASKQVHTHPQIDHFSLSHKLIISLYFFISSLFSLNRALILAATHEVSPWLEFTPAERLLSSLLSGCVSLVAPKKAADATLVAPDISANSHKSERDRPTCVYFHIPRWKAIHLVHWSSVLSSTARLSPLCYHLARLFLPAMVLSAPRRIEGIHHRAMKRPQGLPCCQHGDYKWIHSSPAKKGETLIYCTISRVKTGIPFSFTAQPVFSTS